jgi:hypothetical protein
MDDRSDVITIVRDLRSEWTPLLDRSAICQADTLLDEARSADSDRVREIENELLGVMAKTTESRSLIRRYLTAEGLESRWAYDPLSGDPPPLPAGTLVVCPIDPTHCRKHLRQKGQRLYCAEHDVLLVSADSVPSKE